jgi:UDP-4-amino-4,6-dideoxy-N-acetyl-beta-L-altrosamine transaminase
VTAPLSYGRQWITEEDLAAVRDCLESDYLTQGPRVAELEAGLCRATGAPYAAVVSSGTAALHLAYEALGFGPGDVGVTSAISFVATANGFLYCGGSARFADVNADTGLVDLESLRRVASASPRPKIIAPVDLAGNPFDRLAVRRIADELGAMVVEDAAHSLGATYVAGGERFRVGSCAHADAAILSFHPVKHVTTAEGGAILTRHKHVYERILSLRSHGIHRDAARFVRGADDPYMGPWYYEQTELGHHYRLPDVLCALGTSQLKRLESFVARRRELASLYDRAFASEPFASKVRPLRAFAEAKGGSAYHLYVVQLIERDGESLRDLARRRRHLFESLRERGIFAQVHYIPIPWQPFYAQMGAAKLGAAEYRGAESYYARSISLPMFPAMENGDVERVVAAVERGLN